jgi:hypothetical protein
MVGNCSSVYTFYLDKLVVAQLDKKFPVFYVTCNVIIAVFISPLRSAYPEPFFALYSLYAIPHFRTTKLIVAFRSFSNAPKECSVQIVEVFLISFLPASLFLPLPHIQIFSQGPSYKGLVGIVAIFGKDKRFSLLRSV